MASSSSSPAAASLLAALLLSPVASALADVAAPPLPTPAQVRMLDNGLAQFMHFSVDPYTSIEHNCVGTSGDCIPASVFNPTNLSTDQWVEAAVAFGADEICLTAHHEGGFCLWDTKFSNYSVMHSPYGKDIVAQFVASCKKHGVKPCYYMGPNANGWLANNQSYSADAFVAAQLGMLRELLTNYGTDYVSRLWWDHYPSGCGGLAPCPNGSFPAAWPQFVSLVREVSPSTIICPGPDCDGHQGESGIANYPSWMPCEPQFANDTELKCDNHAPVVGDGLHTGFHPYESCATMHNGWFCKGNCTGGNNVFWSPRKIWDVYMTSVGVGSRNTLNAPPGTTGQIAPELVQNMAVFGSHLRALLVPVGDVVANGTVTCGTGADTDFLELDLPASALFNAVMIREDLAISGQVVAEYSVEFFNATANAWTAFPSNTSSVREPPAAAHGQCSATMSGVNLVTDAPPGCHRVAQTADAAACASICAKDAQCNFYTWHDPNQGSEANWCYVRYGDCYDYHPQSGHFSGFCNHTFTSNNCGGGAPPSPATTAMGVHGVSVGARMIDFVPETAGTKVRFHCRAAVNGSAAAGGGGGAAIRSFSAHYGVPPPGPAA